MWIRPKLRRECRRAHLPDLGWDNREAAEARRAWTEGFLLPFWRCEGSLLNRGRQNHQEKPARRKDRTDTRFAGELRALPMLIQWKVFGGIFGRLLGQT